MTTEKATADLTIDKILEAKREIEKYNPISMAIQSDPFSFAGLKVYTTPQVPKLKLSKDVLVSESFRTLFDAWLVARFGFRDVGLKRDEVFLMFGNTMIMRPETAALLHNGGA